MKNGKKKNDWVFLYVLPGFTALCGIAMTVLCFLSGNVAAAAVLGILFAAVPAAWILYAFGTALRGKRKVGGGEAALTPDRARKGS